MLAEKRRLARTSSDEGARCCKGVHACSVGCAVRSAVFRDRACKSRLRIGGEDSQSAVYIVQIAWRIATGDGLSKE